jgi:hypothetical protein
MRIELNKQQLEVWAIPCTHSIPTIGFGCVVLADNFDGAPPKY